MELQVWLRVLMAQKMRAGASQERVGRQGSQGSQGIVNQVVKTLRQREERATLVVQEAGKAKVGGVAALRLQARLQAGVQVEGSPRLAARG